MLLPQELTESIADLRSGKVASIGLHQPAPQASPTTSAVVFSGAFNPRHQGHRQMATIAEQILGERVVHEISITNVDKQPIDADEISLRISHFHSTEPIWLTRSATFVEKAVLFPGATFVVGADTIQRIADPRYYDGEPGARDAAIVQLEQFGCRFLVFGRLLRERFRALAHCELPHKLLRICRSVPEERFRIDVSSTELRDEPPSR